MWPVVVAIGLLAASCTSSRRSAEPDAVSLNPTAPAGPAETFASTGAAPPGTTPPPAPVGGSRPGTVARQPSAVPGPGSTQAPQPSVPSQPLPTIFPAVDDRVGISDATISVCTHYRKYLGKVLDTGDEDFDIYWRWLNDRGGIHGRRVQERTAEDGGGRLAAQAYEECRGAFLLRGAPGAEAITPMRKIVEADPRGPPYLHFLARAEAGARRSFSFYPSHETFGRLTGQFVLSRFAGARIAVIHKASNGWDAGHQGFLAAFREAGVSLVADVPLSPGDPIVADELAAVQRAGAEVVWAWVEGLDAIQLIKQSNAQRYPMRWVVPYAFNTFTEPLGDDALRPAPITGLNVTPPATPGHYTGPFAPYAAEYRRFEEAYRTYRGKPVRRDLADSVFWKWLEDRHLADLLEKCGRDCTRNRLVAPLVSGSFSALEPVCAFDFRRGRAAGYRASAFEAAPAEGGPIWVETIRCADRF